MGKEGWIHGSTVDADTHEVRYLSPSSLQLADMTTEKGCLRKWWYAYVKGLKEPQTLPQREGEADHACVERYLETGQRHLRPRVAKGLHLLPPPGPHLQIEHDMAPFQWTACTLKHQHSYDCPPCPPDHTHTESCRRVSGLHLSALRAHGIPVVGRIDLMHDLGLNYGTDSPETVQDPPGTVEVFDHKFTKDLRYALKGPDLLTNIQMVAYGEYVFRTVPGVQRVRLSHGYYPTNGSARKSTVITPREPLTSYWSEHVEPLARSIAEAAKEQNPDKVNANLKACRAFGRPCMHAEYCSAAMDAGLGASLQSQVGGTAAKALIDFLRKPKEESAMTTPAKNLLTRIKQAPSDNVAREAELAKLKDEEQQAKRAALPPHMFQTISDIETIASTHNLGWPTMVSDAANAYTLLTGQTRSAVGALEGVEVATLDQLDTLVAELRDAYPTQTPTVTAPTVMVAPAPSAPVASILPSDAPAQTTTAQPTEDKAKRSRAKSKDVATPTATPTPTAAAATPTPTPTPTATPTPSQDQRVNLFVDVVIEGGDVTDLGSRVDSLVEAMRERFDVADIRAGGNDSPLAYGKWKGVLAAALRESGLLNAGTYVIDARGNEIYEEAVQAVRTMVKRSGGTYVRGLR